MDLTSPLVNPGPSLHLNFTNTTASSLSLVGNKCEGI